MRIKKSTMNSQFLKLRILAIKVVVIGFILSFYSCDKDDIENEEIVISDNYYVEYVIYGTGSYGRFSNWTATTPEGIYTNSGYQVRSWSQTYGPVSKGFKCEVLIDDYIGGDPIIEIHVSKNNEPFALKVIESGGSASYIIDF